MSFEFYVTIEGSKTGKYKGDNLPKPHQDKIRGLAYDYELNSPRDPVSGLASGKRQHKPITFTKEWGPSTPQLFNALVVQEVLKSVLFEFIRVGKEGGEVIFQTVKLTDAAVSHIHQFKRLSTKEADKFEVQDLEEVSLTFHKIEITNQVTKIMSSDDWATR